MNDDFLKYFNVPVESAWKAAEENTKRDSIIFSMADFFKDVADVKNFIRIPLYVVTNKEMKYGASAIINKENWMADNVITSLLVSHQAKRMLSPASILLRIFVKNISPENMNTFFLSIQITRICTLT